MIVTETKATETRTDRGSTHRINGVDMPALHKLIEDVKRDPANGRTAWGVTTRWAGGAVSETEVSGFGIGGRRVRNDFKIRIDEPLELAGTNTQPNPQEYLLAAFNACMMVGYVALASLHGIELESVEINSEGEIDLRGFLGLATEVKPGYDSIRYTVRVRGDGAPEQFHEIHRAVDGDEPQSVQPRQPGHAGRAVDRGVSGSGTACGSSCGSPARSRAAVLSGRV